MLKVSCHLQEAKLTNVDFAMHSGHTLAITHLTSKFKKITPPRDAVEIHKFKPNSAFHLFYDGANVKRSHALDACHTASLTSIHVQESLEKVRICRGGLDQPIHTGRKCAFLTLLSSFFLFC